MGSGTSTLNIFGGFGGGAGAGAHTNYEADSGGGGGYSGGGGGGYIVGAGGGGGNFVTGTYVSNSLNSGVGYVTIAVAVAPDTTPPTFTSSSSFSAAENIATSATAATIRVSESATVTISSGADAARFNISRSETDTAIIKFNASPDFEAPADVGGNNVYEITLTATDAAANAGPQWPGRSAGSDHAG
jgi:serralysin